jgi:DNA segregation ATPase FtsK/SpoIIIE, S-DNA-T family
MPSDSTRKTRAAEFLGLLAFGVALMLLLALATYAPSDPAPYFRAGAGGEVKNVIGSTGAFVAEMLRGQLFGMAAILLPLVLGVYGWNLFWCKPIVAPYTKAVGIVLLLLSLTCFLTLTVGTGTLESRPGGVVGESLCGLLTERFNKTGAYILVATSLFLSLILSTQFSFAAALSGVGRFIAARVGAATTAWAHFRESRRKERMRREVIRKHTQRERQASAESLPRIRKVRVGAPEEDETEAAIEAAGPTELIDLPLAEPEAPTIARTQPRPVSAPPKPKAAPPSPRGTLALPSTSLLDEAKSTDGVDTARLYEKGRVLQAKCGEFGVMGTVKEIHPGPVVTTYEFKPHAGVKYSKIVGLADDLALALEAESIRVDRVSGKGNVGIEIPNEARETIFLREILESDAFVKASSRLTLALGKTVDGETIVTDLTAMPHLLIAGSTGTGKSVGLNCMIASILFKATPEEVRLVLIDPKRLELGVYEDIPHLLTPVVTDPKVASNVLRWAVTEMEKRIRRLASEGVRNIEQFNSIIRAEKGSSTNGDEEARPLHYIVIVIDELADLMMVSSHEVEEAITRLAQMARAVGIHLILATQRPSVDVLTGLIKANFPSRISFRVAARVDSRTILDSIGAEQLLGRGDMLFLPPGSARLTRIHGAFVSEKEVARLASFLRKDARPVYDDSVGKPERTTEQSDVDDRDDLFDEAVRFVVQAGQASTSMLQRRFRIGFSRAGRLVDLMERDGIVGPAEGSKAREIRVAADYFETVDSWPR